METLTLDMFLEEEEREELRPEDIDRMDIFELEALIRSRFPNDWGLNTSLRLYKEGGKTIKLKDGTKTRIEPHNEMYLKGMRKRLKLLLFGGMYQ